MDTIYEEILTDLVTQFPTRAIRPVMVGICAAAFNGQEEESIDRVLQQLARQGLVRSQWAISLFLNWPEGAQLDRCAEIAQRAREELGITVHILQAQLPKGTPIGRIRWLLHTAISRLAAQTGADPIHVNVDCDTVSIHPNMLTTFQHVLRGSAVLAVGDLRFDHPEITTASIPVLAFAQEVLMRMGKQVQHIVADPFNPYAKTLLIRDVLGTAVYCNMAWKNSTYDAVGGMPCVRLHEWHHFFRKVWEHTGSGSGVRFLNGSTRVDVNSRRWLWAYHLEREAAPNRQWEVANFPAFTAVGDRVRNSLPEITNGALDSQSAQRALNQVLSGFHLPLDILPVMVSNLLHKLGLTKANYQIDIRALAEEPEMAKASVEIHNAAPLLAWGRKHCS